MSVLQHKALRVALGLALVLAVMSVADGRGFRRHLSLEREISTLGSRNQKLTEDNRALLDEIDAMRKDPKALERAAREELGFVKPGEVIINVE